MKSRWITVVLCLIIVVFLVVRLRPRGGGGPRSRQAASSGPSSANAYLGLRSLVLQGTRANFGLGPGSSPTQPFALVMDWGLPEGTATVVAIADGSASVYLSNGSASIGGGQSHEEIRKAALHAVELANDVQPRMHPATEFPLATRGQVNFYLVTDAGVFTATSSEDDLRNDRSPFARLGDAAQAIITEYRKIETKP